MSQNERLTSSMSLEDQQLLEQGIHIRKNIIQKLIKGEKGEFVVPDSTSEKELLSRSLDSIDNVIFKKIKAKQVDDEVNNSESMAVEMANLIKEISSSRSNIERREPPTLPSHIEVKDVVPGETEQSGSSEQVRDEVLSKME